MSKISFTKAALEELKKDNDLTLSQIAEILKPQFPKKPNILSGVKWVYNKYRKELNLKERLK
ncbi:MAG: hypothetical protein NC833_03125 [Candidatus Omnitrophica bacterium]|nr:hypothetical protein [Candidatus Omnitrophota bacterium]